MVKTKMAIPILSRIVPMTKSKTHQRRLSEMTNPIPFLVVGLVVGVPLVAYILFLGLTSIPYLQRQ